MLLFIDLPKNIRILRVEEQSDGTTMRTKVASVAKHKMEITPEIRTQLSADELTEVESVIDVYRQADEAQVKAAVLRFPQTVREVVGYVLADEISDLEKRLVLTSLLDGVSRLRRSERDRKLAKDPLLADDA